MKSPPRERVVRAFILFSPCSKEPGARSGGGEGEGGQTREARLGERWSRGARLAGARRVRARRRARRDDREPTRTPRETDERAVERVDESRGADQRDRRRDDRRDIRPAKP